MAGANDCHSYVWRWDLWPSEATAAPMYGPRSLEQESQRARWAPAAETGASWPQPEEVCSLAGHRHDVLLLQFSHDGQGIATGSKDGSVRVCSSFRHPSAAQ